MKSCRGLGGTFSFVQVESEIDLDYIKQILDETKQRVEGQSFMEQRAEMVQSLGEETSIEDEMQLAHEEIQKMEKDLKSLLTVTEFLFETQEELQSKLDQ